MEIKLYKMLKKYKYRLSKQQHSTIKGLIRIGNYEGAYKGIMKILRTQ